MKTCRDLPAHVEPFIHTWLGHCGKQYSEVQRLAAVRGLRGPDRNRHRCFASGRSRNDSKTGVWTHFVEALSLASSSSLGRERGPEATLVQYRHYLRRFGGLPSKSRPATTSRPASFRGRRFHPESGKGLTCGPFRASVAFSRSFSLSVPGLSDVPLISVKQSSHRADIDLRTCRVRSPAEVEPVAGGVDRRNISLSP